MSKLPKLALLTIRAEIADMYMHDLKELFQGYLELHSYSMEREHQNPIHRQKLHDVDVLLTSHTTLVSDIQSDLPASCKIVRLEYAFLREKIIALSKLPPNTNALVCFQFQQVSDNVASMLYEFGLKNLNLDAYGRETLPPTQKYDVAIIDNNSAHIPEEIDNVISLGARRLSFSTLISIAYAGGILDKQLENRFFRYCKNLFTPDDFVKDFYGNSTNNEIQLKTIMNCIDYAILICDENYRILDSNSNVCTMFNIRQDLEGQYMGDISPFEKIVSLISEGQPVENRLLELQNKRSFWISSEVITNAENRAPIYIILIKDVTKILSLEKSFQKQLSQRGHMTKYSFDDIVGTSKEIRNCVAKAKIIAGIDKPALITGESGTGKELFAHSIHAHSSRSSFPFIALNCAALPQNLLESELFGYTEGSFTGAKRGGRVGLFETANRGTLFLDEIGDISMETQVRLLRVLEEKEVMRIGSSEIIPVDTRVIAATNQNLQKLVQEGSFRLDLYYRLNTLILNIPPLRQRRSDIPLLIKHILASEQLTHSTISPELMDFFMSYHWYGNVRELRNCVEYMAYISNGEMDLSHLPDYIEPGANVNLPPAHWQEQEPEERDPLSPLNRYESEIAAAILDILSYENQGRRTLLLGLKDSYPTLSEYRLRGILEFLEKEKLVTIGRGRLGMRITEKGMQAAGARTNA